MNSGISMRFFVMAAIFLALSGCQDYKRYGGDSYHKGFSPQLYALGETFPSEWKGKDWDPSAWPLQYQDRDRFMQGLFDADILRDQYIYQKTVPMVVVGPNFYHLSDLDQHRICKTIDMLYGATTGKYGHYLLKDWYSDAVIGDYTKEGLTLR